MTRRAKHRRDALTGPFKQRPDINNLYAAHTVLNRWSSPDEVASAVAFLASEELLPRHCEELLRRSNPSSRVRRG